MKITDSIKNQVALSTEKSDTVKLESGLSQKVDKAQVDVKTSGNVTLSPMSAQLKTLEAKVASSNVFDVEKVNAIKLAITGGQFEVNSDVVADGLIETVKDLLTTRKT